MSQPFKLYRLQQLDSQLDQLSQRLSKIESALQDDSQLRAAQQNAEMTEQRLAEARQRLRKLEVEVKAQQIKVEQNEASLYGGKVRNPKELQDLERESASIKRLIGSLEDQQLDIMLEVEEIESIVQKARQELETARHQNATQTSLLRGEQSNLQKEVERLRSERQATAATISPEDLLMYDQLRQSRKGVAVAKVTDGCCAACGSELTPALIQSAHSSSQLSRCTFCGRILYAG